MTPFKPSSGSSGRSFRRALLLAMNALLISGDVIAQVSPPCEREMIAKSSSPDGSWIAFIQEGTCTSGSVTVSTDTVRLAKRESFDEVHQRSHVEKAEYENDVLVVDYYGRAENRPLLRWLSLSQLQITIPNISNVGLRKRSFQGVDILVTYDPDDPAARQKWRKERGLAPE
jgi:hypothetical protein